MTEKKKDENVAWSRKIIFDQFSISLYLLRMLEFVAFPTGIYLLKVNNRNPRTRV